MDLEKIEKLVKLIENSAMLEFSYEENDMKISMSRKGEALGVVAVGNQAGLAQEVEEVETEEQYILSPIVGTFYSADAPDAKPFVSVGHQVKAGETVCILEAMKLLNAIESDFDCEIEAVLVSNGQKVEYGQPLFRIKIKE